MAAFTLRTDDRVAGELQRLRRAVADPTPAHREIGRRLLTRVQMGFRQSVDPYGTAWAPLKTRRGKPLIDTGRLRASFTFRADAGGVTVGTNVDYGRHVAEDVYPRRLVLPIRGRGLPADWAREVIDVVDAHLRGRS